ncbi:MAG: DUF1573 domain-containing protein [Chthoniobacterales bacterium]|nr:DUF1573 domain-containing protein [Chthoniobacterales bacterium]
MRPVPRRRAPIAALLLGVIFAAPVRAGLVWESTTVTIETHGSPETRTAEFRFRNDSSQPVRIRGVRTSCGCTVAKPEQDVYAPGASGTLRVTHKPKPGPVLRRYRITVDTDESGGGVPDLALVVSGEPRLTVEGRRMLVWEKNESRAPREIVLRIKPGDSLRLTGAAADADLVTAELAGAGDSRVLRVTPKAGATGRARIRLQSEPPLPEMDATFFAVLR